MQNPNYYQKARERLAAEIAREIANNVGTEELEELGRAIKAADDAASHARMLRSKLAFAALERFKG